MPEAPIKLVPGQLPVNTSAPSIVVQAMSVPGRYIFTVTVTDDARQQASASLMVTVRPG